jgi:hypothetical protein
MKKQKIVLGALVFGATLVLAGCGPNIGQKIVEKGIESQTGGKVDVNADKGEMTVKSDQGNISVSSEGTASLDKDFPKDIYIAPDAQIILSMAKGQDQSYSAAYVTGMTVDEIYGKYKEDLVSKGWTIDSATETNVEDSKVALYKKGNQAVTIIIGVGQEDQFAGKTYVQVIGATDKSVN